MCLMQNIAALITSVFVFATACGVDDEEVIDTSTTQGAATTTWAGPVPLSTSGLDARVRFNFGKEIAVDPGGVIHVAWLDVQVDGAMPRGEVYYQRSTAGGTSWSTPLRLSTGNGLAAYPKIALFGPYVYVVWHTQSAGTTATSYITRSTNQGATFTAPTVITTEHSPVPAVAANGSGVHVVFTGSDNEIRSKSSIDFGATWLPTRRVSSADNRTSWTPVIAANGPAIYVAWTDERHNRNPDGTAYDCGKQAPPAWAGDDGCREEIYFRRSSDLGQTWSPELRLTTSPQNVGHNAASLVFANGNLHLAYFRKPNNHYGILYQRSLDTGASFQPAKELTSSPTSVAARPSVGVFGSTVGVVFTQIISGVGARLHYALSIDNGLTFTTPAQVVQGNGLSMEPSIDFDPAGHAHVVFTDSTIPGAATNRVYYARTVPN
jgi:hypothetical protein